MCHRRTWTTTWRWRCLRCASTRARSTPPTTRTLPKWSKRWWVRPSIQSACLSFCPPVHPICLFIFLSVRPSIHPSNLPVYHSVCLSVCLSICAFIYRGVKIRYLSINLYTSPVYHPFICLPVQTFEGFLSVHPFVHLSVCLSKLCFVSHTWDSMLQYRQAEY